MIQYCPTCLSKNRKLQKLSNDQSLILEKILPEFEFKNNAKLCWECIAIVLKILTFYNRAKSAEILLQNYYKCKSTSDLISKSQLRISKVNELSINIDTTASLEEELISNLELNNDNEIATEGTKVIKNKRIRRDKDNYKCTVCDKLFETRGTYEYHRQKHKRRPECKKCNLTFISKTLLWSHNNIVHKQVKRYACSICKRIFFTEIGYQTHLANHSAGQSVYYCKPCDKFYKTNSSYLKHKRTSVKHYDPKSWKFDCSTCNRKFQTELQRKEHNDVVHLNIKKFNCKFCLKKYSSSRSLNYHIKIKHKHVELPKNQMCHICGKAFKSSQILSIHTRTHTTV